MSTPSIQRLKQALSLAEQIQNLEAQLSSILGQAPTGSPSVAARVASPPVAAPKKKYTMSAAHRAALVKAQKARWAEVRVTKPAAAEAKPPVKTPAAQKPAARKKGKMSAAGRANIVKAQKARWAKLRAGKAGKKA